MPSKPYYNAAHALDRAARAHSHRTSLVYNSEKITVMEAAVLTRKLAQLLGSCGVSQGDRVVLISHNSPYHLLMHVACARLGAVFVPISYRLRYEDMQKMVDFCSPRVIVVEPEVGEQGMFYSTGTTVQFVIDDDGRAPAIAPALRAGYFALSAAYTGFDGEFITDNPDGTTALNSREYPEGPAALLFTSGTDGVAKAVMLTHKELWWGSRNFREGFEYSTLDVELVVAPLSHIGGFNGTTLDLFTHGGTVVIMRDFDAASLLRMLEKYRVRMMFGVPTMFTEMLAEPNFADYDLSAFRLPLIGGAPATPALLQQLEDAGLEPLNVYGMTELAAAGCYLPAEYLPTHRGSIGRPFAHVTARIVDPETAEDSKTGELWLQGPNVITSYWHGAAAESFVSGWFRTGDLVRVDDQGFLWLVGRIGGLINSGGENISPEEISDVISRFPGVAQCAVVGVPDEKWGETVGVALVLKPGAEVPTLSDVQDFTANFLARYKLPRILKVLSQLPLNSHGKVDRAAVVDLLS
ncbi:MAG: AMP-binding protein [Trueperella sp.]|nr:AMP-binding protein [Trueperella sp.]